MSARQQRLAELWRARGELDTRIDAMTRRGADGAWNDDPLPPPKLWQDVATANRRVIEAMVALGVRHIRHDLSMVAE